VHKSTGKSLWLIILLLALAPQAAAQYNITNFSPTSIPVGSPDFSLIITLASTIPPSTQISVTFNSSNVSAIQQGTNQISALIPMALIEQPGVYPVTVTLLVGTNTFVNSANYTVTAPTIASVQPAFATVGQGAFTMTINGSGFFDLPANPQPQPPFVNIGTLSLTANVINNSQIRVTVPASITASAQNYYLQVVGPGEFGSNVVVFPVIQGLTITTTSMPAGTVNSPYSLTFTTTGGVPPLTFSATGLPTGLTLNSSTGVVSGAPTTAGTYPIVLTVNDSSSQTAVARYFLSVQIPLLSFTSNTLPNGITGAQYSTSIVASGGVPPYTFSLATNRLAAGGTLPPGLSLGSDGSIFGTPTTIGTFNFGVTVSDSANTTISQGFSITITVPPLTITNGTLANAPQGSPLNLAFIGYGGNPPYTFSAGTGLPPGTTLSSSGILSGSPTTQGVYSFPVTVKDTAGGSYSKTFSLTVVAPLISILTRTLPNGQVGTAYSVQLFATGGSTPYAWSISGAPAGLTLSATGLLSGTPTADGAFTPTVSITDPAKDLTSLPYTLTITPAPLVITTQTLVSGVAGTAYSATLNAVGGDLPYTWTAPNIPSGLSLSAAGVLSGTPSSSGTYSIPFTVTDSKKATATTTLGLVIKANAITITTTALPNGTVSSLYSFTVAATGGAGSNKWAATNLPPGLSISGSTGTISGSPTSAGQYVTVVTVTDAAGTVGVQTFTLSILLPTTPVLNFSNLPATGTPGQQTNVQVGLISGYPIPVNATLTLTFTPDSGPDDPGVQFSSGGRSVTIPIPAGSTSLIGGVALQYGTTSGTITITADLVAAGQDITPTPTPSVSVRIAAAAPVISSVSAIRGSSGFTVTVIGFATPRQVTQATYTFAAQSSANLQTNSLTVPVTSLFSTWYSSAAAGPFGSQFSFVQSFSVNGSVSGITSVTVTLTDAQGNSTPVTANLQ
jgi:hypothetical protein